MPQTVMRRLSRENLPPAMQQAWDQSTLVAGEAVTAEVMAHNEAVWKWYLEDFYVRLFTGQAPGLTLDPRTKELLRLRLSKGHGCHVCNSHNIITAREAGFSDAQIEGTLDPSPELFDERDRCVIALAAQIALDNEEGHLSAQLYERLLCYYDDAQIVEMGVIAAVLTGFTKFLFVFDLVTREATCPVRTPTE